MGLLRMAARTAVVAGTATAVSGRVQRRQAARWEQEDAQQYLNRALSLNPNFHVEQAKVAVETLRQLGTRVSVRASGEAKHDTE